MRLAHFEELYESEFIPFNKQLADRNLRWKPKSIYK